MLHSDGGDPAIVDIKGTLRPRVAALARPLRSRSCASLIVRAPPSLATHSQCARHRTYSPICISCTALDGPVNTSLVNLNAMPHPPPPPSGARDSELAATVCVGPCWRPGAGGAGQQPALKEVR